MIRDPKILLLDEATSALDNQSESLVQAALERASVGRTTLIVAHRLSTIRNADLIFVLSKGVIVESGTYNDLLERKGHFFNLAKDQADQVEAKKSTDSKYERMG